MKTMMADHTPEVTLSTLHDDVTAGFAGVRGEMRDGFAGLKSEMRDGFADLKSEMRDGFTDLKSEMRAGFTDLKTTLVTGFAALPTRGSSEEMVRLLRESNRLQEARFGQLDGQIGQQRLEVQQALHTLATSQVALTGEIRALTGDVRALMARIDALIRGRGNGAPPA